MTLNLSSGNLPEALTDFKGYLSAMKVVRAHRITEYFVYSYLEIPWDEVHNSVMNLSSGNLPEALTDFKGFLSPADLGPDFSLIVFFIFSGGLNSPW